MERGYPALPHGGDVPVPVLWGMQGLVPATFPAHPSPAPFTSSPSPDRALPGTQSHGQPHEHCPVLLLLPCLGICVRAPQSSLLSSAWILH